ncbi:MAG: Bcr/CflA family efflux MFS transporter [Gammaproteobacteria bacterium]|nr:Bcr/CflA family efflux MFS transporter [Gammaproteobacteria bacterium]
MDSKWSRFVFGAILSVCIIVPFSNDIFISGFPEMSRFFVGANISLILSVFFLSLAIAQPIYGPLSDHFGRRPVLLVGLWIYTIASIIIITTDSFSLLIVGRFFQALGVCSAAVSVYAIIRDVCGQEKLVSATSSITAVIGAGPAIAPLFGGLLVAKWGWRSSFVFLLALGFFYTLLIQFFFKETNVHRKSEKFSIKKIIRNYIKLSRLPNFVSYCIARGFSYGIFFSYFSLSSLFVQQQMHFSAIIFGVFVAINGFIMIVMVKSAPAIVNKFSLQKTICLGFALLVIGGLIMWAFNVFVAENIYTFLLPMFVVTAGVGLSLPTASAGAMQIPERKVAGMASSFVNSVSYVFGALATGLAPMFISHVYSFGGFVAVAGITGLIFFYLV